jgi:hypothetical protein
MARPDWADYHPPPEYDRAAAQEEEAYCERCDRYRSQYGTETCPACGD